MSSVAYMDVVIGLLATITMLVTPPGHDRTTPEVGTHVHMATLPPTHFQVLGDLTLASSALELFLPTCLLMLGNQSHVPEVLLCQVRKRRHPAPSSAGSSAFVILETVIVAIAVTGSVPLPPPARSTTTPARSSPTPPCTAFRAMARRPSLSEPSSPRLSRPRTTSSSPPPPTSSTTSSSATSEPAASNKKILIVSRLMVVLLGLWALVPVARHTESVLEEIPLRLHHLLRRAHAGHPRRVFLEARHRRRSRHQHRRRHLRNGLLGHRRRPPPLPHLHLRARRHPPRPPRLTPLPRPRQPHHP